MLEAVLAQFGMDHHQVRITALEEGLINHTWKIEKGDTRFILQRVNEKVFTRPWDIAHNISLMADYLKSHHPEYYFVAPIPAVDGKPLVFLEQEGYFRLFPYVPDSHTLQTVETPGQAYEAAYRFGEFTALLNGVDIRQLKITLPSFHDLSLRQAGFLRALKVGNAERVRETADLSRQLLQRSGIVDQFERIRKDPSFRQRVTHHDTKISNILFDRNDHGICVIDLDTVMPGYFISDVGDMMRTYLSPVSEEEADISRIEIRDEYYRAIHDGYLDQMGAMLEKSERHDFFYSGSFLIYMQAIRFLTDYLNNDSYYGARYPGHNLVRARNQATLLERYLEKEDLLRALDRS